MRVMPGDALTALMAESGNVSERELAKLRRDLGLDKPYYQQYLIWMWQMVSLNPGYSIFTNEPIAVALKKSIPVTLELATLAMILGLVIAIPIGVLSATRQDKAADYVGRVARCCRPSRTGTSRPPTRSVVSSHGSSSATSCRT
jgi:ABC-type dipeptide/oligopeptide/nickel transport system permease component